MDYSSWYAQLVKPSWAPPQWLFGPVWSVLYVLIGISYLFVFVLVFNKRLPKKSSVPFILNLVFNFAFTPIQFGLRNNLLAAIDILLVLFTLIWAVLHIEKYYKWVAFLNLPYLAWVSFATVLQLSILFLNL